LEIRVTDARGTVLLRESRDLGVPEASEEAPFPAGYSGDFNALTRRDLVHLTTLPSIELLPPGGDLLTGEAWFKAATSGGPIGVVEFYRDGELLVQDPDPPYVHQLQIPAQRHVFEAVALDPQDRELDRSQQVVRRQGPHFAVRLQSKGEIREGRQDVSANVIVPLGETLATVSFYLNDRLLEEVKAAPWICSAPGPPYRTVLFVRAVARLESGEEAEDLLFLTRLPAERVDVKLASLFVSVLGPSGQPVTDLEADEISVIQDGKERTLRSVDTVENLPLSLAVLLDTSSSMGRRLLLAAASVQHFFEDTLKPLDKASLLTFSNDFRQRMPFTTDSRHLAQAALGMRAFGTTRLHDAVVYSLASFYGQKDRRALVVLSDGADNGSDYPFQQVLEAASRARTMVFTVSLGLLDEGTKSNLEILAEKTGGRSFRVSEVEQLDQVLQSVARVLRTQYHIIYEPAANADPGGLPSVEVQLLRPGLTSRVVRGD
jgi:VWFA-related protein